MDSALMFRWMLTIAAGCVTSAAVAGEPRTLFEVGRDYTETRLFSVCRVRPTSAAAPLLAIAGFSNDGHGDIADLAVYELTPDSLAIRWRQLRGGADASSIRTLRAADLDGDGGQELIGLGRIGNEETDSRGELQVFQFRDDRWDVLAAQRWQSGEYTHGYGMDVADLNADGRPEIVTGGFTLRDGRDQAELRVWNLVDHELKLTATTTWGSSEGHTRINAVGMGDLDGDARMEIVTAGRTGQMSPEEHVTTAESDQLIVWQLDDTQLVQVATYAGDPDTRSRIRELKLAEVDGQPGLELVAVGRQAPVRARGAGSGRGRGDGSGGGRGDGSGGGRGDGTGGGRRNAESAPLRPLFTIFQLHGDQLQKTASAEFGDALGETRDVAIARDSTGNATLLTITADDLKPQRQARLEVWRFADESLHSIGSATATLGDETRARQLMLWGDPGQERILTIGFVHRDEQILGQILDWGPVAGIPAP